MTRSSVLLLTAAAFAAAAGQILFRIGALGRQSPLDFLNLPILGGLLLYGLGTAAWIFALSRDTLVHVYAFTALTFVLVYLAGVLLLGETLQPRALLGVALVLAGLYLITA